MYRYIVVTAVLLATFGFVFGVAADTQTDKGPAELTIQAGSRGPVPFPHQAHQKRLKDCMVCHSMFEQEKDSIEKAKTDGRLAKKQVMNKLCIHCHRTESKAGNPSGPTTCSKCHEKK